MKIRKFWKSALCGIMSAVMLGNISVYAGDYGMGDEIDFSNIYGYYMYGTLINMPDNIYFTLTNDMYNRTFEYYNNTRDSVEKVYKKTKQMCENGKINNYLTKNENGDTCFKISTMVASDPKYLLADYSTVYIQNYFYNSCDRIFGSRIHEMKFADTFTKVSEDLYVTCVQATINIEEEVSKMDAENEALVYAKVFYAFEQMGVTYDLSGDANTDAEVNVRDAAFIAQKLAARKYMEIPGIADFNGNEKVDVRDAAAIARYLANSFK